MHRPVSTAASTSIRPGRVGTRLAATVANATDVATAMPTSACFLEEQVRWGQVAHAHMNHIAGHEVLGQEQLPAAITKDTRLDGQALSKQLQGVARPPLLPTASSTRGIRTEKFTGFRRER